MPRNDPPDPDDRRPFLSRRAVLASAGTVGVAGLLELGGTSGTFRDEETFGGDTRNTLQAGGLDLVVDSTVRYHDGIASTPRSLPKGGETDRPGAILRLADVKPGDVVEGTLRARVLENPAFLGTRYRTLSNRDAGMTDPEDEVNGPDPDDSDGTPGGDLADAINCVLWYDGYAKAPDSGSGNPWEAGIDDPPRHGFLGEIWTGTAEVADAAAFVAELGAAARPGEVFETEAELVISSGTLADLSGRSTVLNSGIGGGTPDAFQDSWCFDTDVTQRIGVLCWIPRERPGTNDNVIQTDELAYEFGMNAIQCRHNVAADGGPIDPPGRSRAPDRPDNGSFEAGFRGWTVGQDLPKDPNDPDELVDASAAVSTEEASRGKRSAEFFIDGVADEGTIWVQQPVDFAGVDGVAVDVHSRAPSANVITRAAVYWGPVPETGGLAERDFDTSRAVEDHSGWETYEYPISYDGRGLVAAGISVVWEGPATRYLDDVRLL